jgi:hypothetical protein
MMKITPILSHLQKIRNWTNQQSKSYGIGQKKNSAPLARHLLSPYELINPIMVGPSDQQLTGGGL